MFAVAPVLSWICPLRVKAGSTVLSVAVIVTLSTSPPKETALAAPPASVNTILPRFVLVASSADPPMFVEFVTVPDTDIGKSGKVIVALFVVAAEVLNVKVVETPTFPVIVMVFVLTPKATVPVPLNVKSPVRKSVAPALLSSVRVPVPLLTTAPPMVGLVVEVPPVSAAVKLASPLMVMPLVVAIVANVSNGVPVVDVPLMLGKSTPAAPVIVVAPLMLNASVPFVTSPLRLCATLAPLIVNVFVPRFIVLASTVVRMPVMVLAPFNVNAIAVAAPPAEPTSRFVTPLDKNSLPDVISDVTTVLSYSRLTVPE